MDKQTYIENIPSIELGGQVYTTADNTLITSLNAEVTFDPAVDYIEYFIYNGDKVVIDSVETLDTYAIYGTDLSINPEKDLESRAYINGKYYTVYNFLRPLLSSSIDETYYISQISTDRTEIRLASTVILPADTFNSGTALKASIDASPLYKDFSLNFGSNELIIANNILVDNTDPENTTLLVKLYEPLPSQFDLQTECWAVEKVAESTAYLINIQTTFAQEEETVQIKGPNFNIIKASETNKAVDYQSSDSLFNAPSSSYTNQLQSILAEKGVELNIEYSDYSNFVFFSSAQTRLENFYYKLTLLESYAVSASYGEGSISYYNSGSDNYWNNKIQETITNFDGYEYYLYYDSGSTTWPKSNSTPPYINVPSTSSIGQTWINNQLTVASLYDENNKDNLVATIPLYIREDEDNANYELFVEMVGQHFDSIWTYTKAVTEKYNSDNRVESGLSKDLVGTALKDFGIKLYQNNFTSDNLYNTYLGITPSGSLLPYTGQEVINTYVTASATGSLIPLDNLSSEVYKRIYHNLPFLLKKKGTVAGLRNLITAFGIPDTIFRINEYGGKDKNTNTWDQWQNTYNNALHTLGTSFVSSSFVLNSSWGALSDQPQAIEFRFKTPGIPASSHYSQSLWSNDNGAVLILKYTGSANTSGSYTGSIVDPYNQYGTLIYYPDSASPAVTASIYLPYFDQGWWSVLINKTSTTDFTVYAKNNNYQTRDGNTIGFQASSSVSLANNWATSTLSYFGSSSLSAKVFSGSLQEIRYYVNALSESVFNDYVMNPNSIEGNSLNSSANELAFRAALGSELYTSSISIHPKVSGQAPTSSFVGTSNFFVGATGIYRPNTEYFFYDQPVAGIKNAVSDKIKVVNTDLYETTLSAFGTLQQNYAISQSYTPNVNYLEVGFSPQNEINEDINSQIGYFNIGDYIGDPRQMSSDAFKYPDLEAISLEYFEKYTASYNYTDYLRLIKFFDNSLFKLIKDFTPARTATTTGGIIKQHLLERNRQRPAQVSYSQPEYTASVTSVARDYQTGSIGVFTGGTGGSVDNWVNIPQSWSSSLNTKAGIVNQINSSEYEFYNGEYSGSTIDVVNNKLQDNPLLGSAFRVSIPDLQNLNVSSNTAISSSGLNNNSITIPFKIQTTVIDYYNTTTSYYTPRYPVQADFNIYFTASIQGTGSSQADLFIQALKDGVAIGQVGLARISVPFNIQFSGSLLIPNQYITPGSNYSIALAEAGAGIFTTITASFNSATTWTVTVDNLSAQSTYYLDPTVFTQQNFPGNINQYSDYNSLLNNVYSNRVSNKYYDVDYSNDLTNPVNFQSIISESALYAQVQDSNYILGSAWDKGRYSGTKLTSATYNRYTAGDISYAEEAVISNYSDYFAVFSNNTSAYPEYPGGSNFKLIAILDTTGQIFSLTGDNQYLGFVSNIFKKGTSAIAYAKDVSNQNTATNLTVVEGGAVYNTIILKSGSANPALNSNLDIVYEIPAPVNDTTYDDIYFQTSSISTLIDTGSAPVYSSGWLSSMVTSSSPTLGKVIRYGFDNEIIQIYNKKTSRYVTGGVDSVEYEETYFPLQVGDFIRFGSDTGGIEGVDYSFSQQLYAIKNLTAGDYNDVISTLGVATTITGSFPSNQSQQNFRIFRRVLDETSVVVSTNPQINITSGEVGLLIPESFNPNYDPVAIAKAAGLIA